jgi:hypothetical protein
MTESRLSAFARRAVVGVAGLVAVACQTTTAPLSSTVGRCGAGVVSVAVMTGVTLACDSSTTLTLDAGGASYLVVPQFATDTGSMALVGYTISASGGVVASPSMRANPFTTASFARTSQSASLPTVPGPGPRQRSFDAAIMNRARQVRASPRTQPPSSRALALTAIPTVGSTRQFQVVSSTTFNRYTPVTGQLVYAGNVVLLYLDTQAPANGFSSSDLQGFGQLFDQTLYPIDTAAFGSPSDVDANGHLIMLMSPVVNALTPSSTCTQSGFIGGFFNPGDLENTANSNGGEIFYSIVPDPNGTVSCAHSVSDMLLSEPPVFLHELQHLINFSQHFVLHGGQPEIGWLDEGLSIIAEELGSIYYEQKFPPPSGRTSPAQLFPDSSQGFINGLLVDSYDYLLQSDTTTVTLHSDSDLGLNWRGGDWLLLRWLGDQKGSSFYRTLEQSTNTGGVNIANAAGESFQSLFGDFSLSLFTDSLPGVPRGSIPARNRFLSRNLRRLYQRLYDTSSPQDAPRPFPILTTSLIGTISASMVPGTMSFYRLNTAGGSSTVTIQLTAPNGAKISSQLHPQISVFRLPPGV